MRTSRLVFATRSYYYYYVDDSHQGREVSSERIAAIFGVQQPEAISLREKKESDKVVPVVSGDESNSGFPHWKLEPGRHDNVYTSPEWSGQDVVPIRSIFRLLPGTTEDDKGDRLQQLSKTFYYKIWHDDKTPSDFRDKFFSRSNCSEQIQAFRQIWLAVESLWWSFLPRWQSAWKTSATKGKWLNIPAAVWRRSMLWHGSKLMRAFIEEEFPDQPHLQEALGLYWLHFTHFSHSTMTSEESFDGWLICSTSIRLCAYCGVVFKR